MRTRTRKASDRRGKFKVLIHTCSPCTDTGLRSRFPITRAGIMMNATLYFHPKTIFIILHLHSTIKTPTASRKKWCVVNRHNGFQSLDLPLLFKGFHTSSPDEDVVNFITTRDSLFGAKVFPTPNHHQNSHSTDNTYSPNSLSPLSQLSPTSTFPEPQAPHWPRSTSPPKPSRTTQPQIQMSPRPEEGEGFVVARPAMPMLLQPTSPIPRLHEWPTKRVAPQFYRAIPDDVIRLQHNLCKSL